MTLRLKSSIIIIVLIIAISSCSLVDKLLTFTISNTATIKIESGLPVGGVFEIVTPDITTNSSKEFENNNTKANLVKDVKLNSLNLTITDPSGKSFSFLKSVRLYISTDSSDEIELAYLEDINTTANTISLIPNTAKLDKYVKASSYKIRTKAVLKETVTKDITIDANMKFKVTADPF